MFPLYEIEDGWRYTLNVTEKTRPVADYLELQRRYRGMADDEVANLQADVDRGWAKLVERAAASRREDERAATA